ncbi:MAG: NAD(P)-dependent oxidoreductase, partial [Verrucomicrobiota bacterium]
VIICSATIGHEATLEAARFVEHKGARFLDAPFTGSKGAAEQRHLVYYVGGDEATLLRARPVLEATSKSIVPMGGIGDAATVKVVTNMIAAVSIQAMSEALALTRKAGIAPELFAAALAQNACRSGTMDLKLPKMTTGDYSPHFSLKHMFKDVQFGIQMARSLGVDLPAATVTGGVMYGALSRGWGDLDFASLFKVYEQLLQEPPTAQAAIGLSGTGELEDVPEEESLEVVSSVPEDAKNATENVATPKDGHG